MKEKVVFAMYLLSRDESLLPENFPNVDLRKLRRKNDLQRTRLAKRVLSELISEMKESNTVFLMSPEITN